MNLFALRESRVKKSPRPSHERHTNASFANEN